MNKKHRRLVNDQKQHKVDLCFGSKKLFRRQFQCEDQNLWKEQWDKARNSSFFLIGSKDETGGNQSCVFSENNGFIELRLRLPPF